MCKTHWGLRRFQPKCFIVGKHRGYSSLQFGNSIVLHFICAPTVCIAYGHITEKRSPKAVPADFNLFHVISS